MFDIFDAITWVIEQIRSGWQGLRTAFQDALSPFLSIIRLLKHDVQMAANERGEAAGGIVASATVLIVSLVTAVATSGGTLAFLAGIPRQLRAIAARIVKSVEQAGSKLKLAFSKIRPVKVDDALETIAEQKRTLAEGSGDPGDGPELPPSHPRAREHHEFRLAPKDLSRSPKGRPTGGETQAIQKENESAILLSQFGFDLAQNPPRRPNGAKPDYLIRSTSGDVYFDCYAPTTSSLTNIWETMLFKVARQGQIVLNVTDSNVDLTALVRKLEIDEIPGLKDIILIDGTEIRRLWPPGVNLTR